MTMTDDWRLQIDLHDADRSQQLTDLADARQLQHDLSAAFSDRVIVTRDEARVFVYTGTREQAEKAGDAIEAEARQRGWKIDVDLCRWHPIAEEWEDPNKALPVNDADRQAERKALMAREREETEKRGYPEFEVRADLPSHRDAADLVSRLRQEGLPAVRRWRYLLVGATDEDSAKTLAEQIRKIAPSGSRVTVEGTWAAAYADLAPNPFAVLRGVGR